MRKNDPILNVVKTLLKDQDFEEKESREKWNIANELLRVELENIDKEKKSSH